MLSSGANVIIWEEMLLSGMKCYQLELCLSYATKCYHLGMKSYHLELMLSSGTKCYHLDEMLSSGANVIIWDNMLSSGMKCYHLELMFSSGT
jgi:hypothetical protein